MAETKTIASEYTFPEIYEGHKTYREAPHHLKEKFLEYVRETHEPEEFPGLYWGGLDRNMPYEFITDFEVKGAKRPNGTKIPCPMCRRNRKFLKGALVYFFALQCIAIIGNECASEEVINAAKRAKEAKDERERQEDFLLHNLPRVSLLIERAQKLQEFAGQIEKIARDFKREAPGIHSDLRRANKAGKGLIISELVDNPAARFDDTQPKNVTVERTFGPLRGAPLYQARLSLVAELRQIETRLAPYANFEDEYSALVKAGDLVHEGRGKEAITYIHDSKKAIQNLEETVLECVAFFDEEHLAAMHAWGQHSQRSFQFSARRSFSERGVLATLARRSGWIGGKDKVSVNLPIKALQWVRDHMQR